MDRNRKIAIIVGVLYIIGTVSGILSLAVSDPIRSAQDQLAAVSANETQAITGALFILSMGLALAMVPVVIFPVLKKFNETLALGYIVFRGGFEAVTDILITASWFLLLPLGRAYIDPGTANASNIRILGELLLKAENQIGYIGTIVFCLGALMFYWVLFQSKLVPRWLSGWGLIAIVPYLAAALLAIFSLIDSQSTVGVVADLPLALQEMVLAVWLIAKGFNPVALTAGTAETA